MTGSLAACNLIFTDGGLWLHLATRRGDETLDANVCVCVCGYVDRFASKLPCRFRLRLTDDESYVVTTSVDLFARRAHPLYGEAEQLARR